MKQINHKQFRKLLKVYYEKIDDKGRKIPLLAYGTFGVGKSAVILDTAREIATEKGKEFYEWNKISSEVKDEITKNPENKFVMIDIRLSEYDTSDIKGLPDFKGESSIIWKSPVWAKLLSNENSDGLILFDEINLASPMVISSVYKILYDRIINEDKIGSNWFIVGCGNTSEDRAYTHELSPPVRDRGGEVILTPSSVENWIDDFAIPNQIDTRIIGFLSWKPTYLHSVDFEGEQKYTTERGWARLNSLIRDVKSQEDLELISGTAIGEGIAREFCAFTKLKEGIDFKAIIENPERLKDLREKIDLKYFFTTAVAERYGNAKEKEITFEKIMKFSEVLDTMGNCEFVVLMWKLCSRYGNKKFYKDFAEKKDVDRAIRDKYCMYMGVN